MKIEQLTDKARKSISDYCINECHAFCCRKGFLVMTPKQVKLVVGNKKRILVRDEVLIELDDGKFSLNLSHTCPSLKDNKCIIHKDVNRPSACKEFPIFITDKKIRLSPRCPAVKADKFYAYVHEFIKLGYEIE